MEDNELITHEINIDNFMTLSWKIPRVITPLELKAMTYKINKLFNLAEVSITEDREDKKATYLSGKWTPELEEKLIELYHQGKKPIPISEELTQMTGDSYFSLAGTIYHKIAYLKRTGKLTKRSNKTKDPNAQRVYYGKKGIYSDEQIKDIKELMAKGLSDGFIRDELNQKHGTKFSKTQIASKVWKIRHEGDIQNEEPTNQAELQEPETTAP